MIFQNQRKLRIDLGIIRKRRNETNKDKLVKYSNFSL